MFTSGIVLLALWGCSSTKLVQSWHEPSYTSGPLKKILVLGVFKSDLHRRSYEDGLVQSLEKINVAAVPGYKFISDLKGYDEKKEIMAAVEKSGSDGVMIATLVGVTKEEQQIPPSVSYVPSMGFRHGLYNYYDNSYQAVYKPGYTVTNTIVKLETALFSRKTEQMIWAAAIKSINPSTGKKIILENAVLIIENLKKSGLI